MIRISAIKLEGLPVRYRGRMEYYEGWRLVCSIMAEEVRENEADAIKDAEKLRDQWVSG